VALPDGASRFDYESIDPLRRKLYIAHLGASSIVTVNVATRHVQSDLHGIADVHGVLAVPSLAKLFASATGSGQVVMISENGRHPYPGAGWGLSGWHRLRPGAAGGVHLR
jgi:hypothetical protein